MIAHYALMPPDPTTQAHLVVITEADEGALTLSVAGQSIEASGTQIPSAPEYIYSFRVSGLLPGRAYTWSIPGLGDGLPLKTLPGAMPLGGVVGVVASDMHLGASVSNMDIVGAQSPDFALFCGDMVSAWSEDYSEENARDWIAFAQNVMPRLSENFLVPVFYVPGNHDVGNHTWRGTTGGVNPAGTYFRVFFPSVSDMEPQGENYAAPLLGDWLQVMGIDTHSATISDTSVWAAGAHNNKVPVSLPILHSPTAAANIRSTADPDLQENLRNGFHRLFIEAENIRFGVVGHVHARVRTKELGITETDPGGSEKFALLDGGFVVAQEHGGYIEIGQGWVNNRPGAETELWFMDYAAGGEPSFQRIDISQGTFRFRTIRNNGTSVFDEIWMRPRSRRLQAVTADGSAVTPLRADGSPVYPQSV